MVENNTVRMYCFCAVRANQASSCSAPRTRSSVPRTITERGLFSTKRANTLPSMVASSRESVSKACSVTNGEREDHLNRAGVTPLPREFHDVFPPSHHDDTSNGLSWLGVPSEGFTAS